jgi:hypothetical protein
VGKSHRIYVKYRRSDVPLPFSRPNHQKQVISRCQNDWRDNPEPRVSGGGDSGVPEPFG